MSGPDFLRISDPLPLSVGELRGCINKMQDIQHDRSIFQEYNDRSRNIPEDMEIYYLGSKS